MPYQKNPSPKQYNISKPTKNPITTGNFTIILNHMIPAKNPRIDCYEPRVLSKQKQE